MTVRFNNFKHIRQKEIRQKYHGFRYIFTRASLYVVQSKLIRGLVSLAFPQEIFRPM